MAEKYIYEQTARWRTFRVLWFLVSWVLLGLLYFGEIQVWVFIVIFWMVSEMGDGVKRLHREVEQ